MIKRFEVRLQAKQEKLLRAHTRSVRRFECTFLSYQSLHFCPNVGTRNAIVTAAMASSVLCPQSRHYVTLTRPSHQSWARNAMRPWMCPSESCRAVNPAVKTECQACGTEKPKLQGWKCEKCAARNHRGVKRCKQCNEPFDTSKEFWMCAVCGENNRIDELDDNSRCGYCSYDMAPLSLSEERIAELNEQREAEYQARQERFDSVSARDAEEQFGDPAADAHELPPHLRKPAATASSSKLASLPSISPFTPKPVETRHSRIYNRKQQRASAPGASVAAALSDARADAIPPGPPGFDWMCREPQCGHINPGDEEKCLACGVHITPAEWECPHCAALNHLSRARCFNCHAGIPVHWTCPSCQTNTSVYEAECRKCHEPRPAAEPRNVRELRSAEREEERALGSGPRFRKDDWYCSACNGLNFSRRVECYQCGTPRPVSGGRTAAASASGLDSFGDAAHAPARQSAGRMAEQSNWNCPQCHASNFRTRRTCWQCSTECEAGGRAPGGGLAEGDENMPHFAREGFQDSSDSKPAEGRMNVWKKTDDWVCAKCFSKNHRGRSECYKCAAPRAMAVSPRRASVRKPVKL